jgi:hypothetical protein
MKDSRRSKQDAAESKALPHSIIATIFRFSLSGGGDGDDGGNYDFALPAITVMMMMMVKRILGDSDVVKVLGNPT